MGPKKARQRIYVVCTPGLERLLEAELRDLGVRTGRRGYGGVEADVTARQLYTVNVWSRLATRVIQRWTSFRAESFAELELAARNIDWDQWRPIPRASNHGPPNRGQATGGFTFRVSAHKSRLHHTDAIAERLQAAAGAPGEQVVLVRFDHDRATLSIDSTGEALYRRGWRGPVAKAPLRPTLAAGLLLAAGAGRASSIVDPMCGSGTIAIEAARLRSGWPPGIDREFAFQRWPSFEPGTWASVQGERRSAEGARDAAVPIVASDRDAGAVEATRANAEAAGVADLIETRVGSVSELVGPSADGLVVTNPPWGKRLSASADRRDLFAALGAAVGRAMPQGRLALLTDDPALAGHTGRKLAPLFEARQGGLPVHALGEDVGPHDRPVQP
ncbi:MAG: hypothetical protein HKN26_09780 [Acidimicrobiales bacterium]|nr:hypothetical protein [Acidimicrobiales bacterium]